MIRAARGGPGRRRRATRRRGRDGVAGGPRGDRGRARRRHRPVEPGHLDRPDPGRARASATRSATTRAPVVAVSPLVDGEVLKGPTADSCAWAGRAADGGRRRRATTATCSTASSPTSGARARCPCCARTRSWPTPRGAGASRAPTLTFAEALAARHVRTVAVLPVKRFAAAKQRLSTGLAHGTRRALAEAMVTDVLVALRRTEGLDEVVVVTAEPVAEALALGYGARVVADPREAGHRPAAQLGLDAVEGADVVLLVPGDCPALDPAELTALLQSVEPAPSVVLVPDRHGTGTNGARAAPADRDPAVVRPRQPRAPRGAGRGGRGVAARSRRCRRSCSTSTRPTTWRRCARRSSAPAAARPTRVGCCGGWRATTRRSDHGGRAARASPRSSRATTSRRCSRRRRPAISPPATSSSSRRRWCRRRRGASSRLADVAPSPRARGARGTLGKDPRAVEVVLGETEAVVRAVRAC